MSRLNLEPSTLSPLEAFVRDYVEARGGAWDEIEPRVYDLLVGPDVTQVAFDPEALPEHPMAQLASLGSPLIDGLLADAEKRWSSTRLYRVGLNLHPHDLESRLRRAVALPEGWAARIDGVRRMHFPQAVLRFKATFASDQKEEEILALGVDLHYLREVRQLDALTSARALAGEPESPLPEAPHESLAAGYRLARGHAVRSVNALANVRRREWSSRVERQIARMVDYYEQLRREARERAERVALRGPPEAGEADPAERAAARIEGIDREQQLRVAELRQKSAVRVQVKLHSLMLVMQPKLLIDLVMEARDRPPFQLQAVWDPLPESVEAIPCPQCGQPTFAFRASRAGLVCASCATSPGRK